MRLMMCEYTATPEKGPVVHGVCHRHRLEFIIEDGSITAKMIEDEYAAALQRKWEGDIEPRPKKKSPPDVQVPSNTALVGQQPANPAPSTLTQADIDAMRKANAPLGKAAAAAEAAQAAANLKKVEKVV